jgi:phosphonopyruvate decarboxylase
MAATPQSSSPYTLDRSRAVPKVIGDHQQFMIVCGLAGTSKDVAHLTSDGVHTFTMAGAMGAAVCVGLGLALAQPSHQVLVVTGDGELLMNLGSLATVAVRSPANLSILCVDNGFYGETGYQQSHTSLGVDLEAIARGAGFAHTLCAENEADLQRAHDLLHRRQGKLTSPVFIQLKINAEYPPAYKRNLNPSECRIRFRNHILTGD